MPLLPLVKTVEANSCVLDFYGATFGGSASTAGYQLAQKQAVTVGNAFLVLRGTSYANKLVTLSANGSNFTLTATTPTYAINGSTGTGTVTSVTAGTGLTLSAGSGSVNPTIAVSFGTAAGTVCQGNDSRLTSGGTGTVTNIALGSGLSGGPITTTGTISLDADLSAIAALSATTGFLCKTATDTWTLSKHPFNIGFYYEAALATTDKQPIWVAPCACTIKNVKWYRNNTTAPTVAGEIRIKQNGTLIYTIPITTTGASNTLIQYQTTPADTSVAAEDVITSEVYTAGTGIANLSVIVYIERVV